jgi:TolA-binding protein
MTPDQAAAMLLASARRAYNEKNHAFAAARFRDFIARFPAHKEISSARFGLALCLIEGPERDYDKGLEQLTPLAGNKALSEQPFALYYAGLCRRGQGVKALELAALRPAEANTHRNTARERFEDAAKQFAGAVAAFSDRAREAKAPAKGLPIELEWAARARCDRAEMLLRLRKAKDARETIEPFVADKKMASSRYRGLGLYYHGFSCFLLGDHMAAGKSLGKLAPFRDPVFGTHARYLLARVHHLDTKLDEREEARGHYQGVLKDYEADKKAAAEALRQPGRFNNNPEEKRRLERLVKGPPDHVARAMFFLGVLQYEDGRFGEALDHLKSFAEKYPTSPLVPEAQLRQGFCLVQAKQFAAAVKVLQPLADKNALLADQAFLWIGKAQVGLADPKKADSYKSAIDSFRKSAEKAQQRAANNPPDLGAKRRKGEALIELAEAQQFARQFRDAAGTYNQILNEKLLPRRDEEVLQQLAAAWQLAGDYNESDKACLKFTTTHPKSSLLPVVLFRYAENSYFLALAAEKLPNPADRAREIGKHNDEAIKRYKVVIDKFPEFAQVNLARYGLGMAHYRKGQLEEAQKALESIPATERNGDLAIVPYQLADVIIRQAPARAEDAITAGKLEEALKSASELLEAFAGGQPNAPQAPDALLKLGYCQGRMALLQAQPAEKTKALAAARSAYERLLQRFPKHDLAPQAKFERAKVLGQAKDFGGAMNELRAFANDPLKKAPIAPMALLHLATLYRTQNQPAEAVKVMADCRKEHEANLNKDAARSRWVSLLQYHHAVALREAGKLSEAGTLFDQVAKGFPDRPEAWESALRGGQCQKDSAEKKIEELERVLANPGLKTEQRTAAESAYNAALTSLRGAATYLAAQSDALKARKASDDQARQIAQARSRMLYEAAWAHRTLAEREVKKARRKVQLDRWQKRRDEVAKTVAPGQPVPFVAMPEVALADVPVQPAENEAKARYRALIDAFPDVTINADARFELAELLAERGDHKEARKLLEEAIEKEPPAELTEKIKVRLGALLLDRGARRTVAARAVLESPVAKAADKAKAKKQLEAATKDIESALEQLQPVSENAKSALLAQATYREAECYLHLGKRDEAIKRLSKFRDHGPFQNLPGVSDRALLRLGFALGEDKKWDASRQAYELLVARFGASPWANEARYGIGWAQQNLAKYEEAVNAYTQVTNSVATELAARAQINIGLCRLLQKRYNDATTALLVVPFTYDYPELSALALLEAARAFSENKQTAQAIRLLKRVLRDHPDTAAAPAARKRLAELEG